MAFDPDGPVIANLAFIADAAPDECLRQGASWTLERALARRMPIQVIIVARQLTGAGIP